MIRLVQWLASTTRSGDLTYRLTRMFLLLLISFPSLPDRAQRMIAILFNEQIHTRPVRKGTRALTFSVLPYSSLTVDLPKGQQKGNMAFSGPESRWIGPFPGGQRESSLSVDNENSHVPSLSEDLHPVSSISDQSGLAMVLCVIEYLWLRIRI